MNWGTRWALCDAWSALLDNADVLGLIARTTDAMPPKVTRGKRLIRVRGELHATYSHLIATRQPGRGAITADHPLGRWADHEEDTNHDHRTRPPRRVTGET